MQIEAELDEWRFQRRMDDAVSHSAALTDEFAVPMTRSLLPPHNNNKGISLTKDAYRHLLQQVATKEYGRPDEEKQKAKQLLIGFEKPDPVELTKKRNRELTECLRQTLASHSSRKARGESAVKLEKRLRLQSQPHKESIQSMITKSKPYEFKRKNEIEEIEEKLREQSLSRRSLEEDQIFYNYLAKRETNLLVKDVIIDLMYDLVEEAYDEEELASRKIDLPPEELATVEAALENGPQEEVLIQKYNVGITRRHLQCLQPLQWLNDEVINFYIQLLNDRDESLVKSGQLEKRSHFFNSFFYTKLSENGYNFVNVRRWTRKIDIFAMNKIFVPVNISNTHWCMAVIFMTEKRIQYYDSMNGSGTPCLKVLLRYLHDEMEHKKKEKFNSKGWELVTTTPDTPQQANGSDCGVFSCMFADYISQQKPLLFSQNDMEFHRHRMVLHIVRGFIPLDEEL